MHEVGSHTKILKMCKNYTWWLLHVCKQYIILNHVLSEKIVSLPKPFPTEFPTAFPADDLHILKNSHKISCSISCKNFLQDFPQNFPSWMLIG